MATRVPFPARLRRILPILILMICLGTAQAQHGVGGIHFGGGHFGGGHSSGGHTSGDHSGGHFGWLHFGKHSGGHGRSVASSASTSDASTRGPSSLWNFSTTSHPPSRIPSTLLWSPPLAPGRADGRRPFFVSSRMRRGHFRNRFHRFSSSGCFFNDVSQVCFFEPFFPLLDLGGYLLDFGFGGDSLDFGDELNSQELLQSEVSAVPPANRSDDDTTAGNSRARPGVMPGMASDGRALSKGEFLLVLNNGSSHAVTDYWVADGYLEYVSPDGSRSHVPLEALNLQDTVNQNAPRGAAFVLRSWPAGNR